MSQPVGYDGSPYKSPAPHGRPQRLGRVHVPDSASTITTGTTCSTTVYIYQYTYLLQYCAIVPYIGVVLPYFYTVPVALPVLYVYSYSVVLYTGTVYIPVAPALPVQYVRIRLLYK